ncbi:hypothetical protein HN592_02425 [Candidatus Woesearchaeota archaeon]|jgi:hypothetical protein|nr:hypothetical protein [Candidatus Woesearchaeota archaeon]MBT4368067.1 hypothetical protein [Candidatus Woesearchaeota archaeon]MBT4712555.1 hypothetical protein [Candidatus Woesearchaeota archaeon]MBT6639468.1 hypothetical protein [Candidatus Woesearchaeota archaeon]MBT7133640.1 hypothetical protein [Candidatus Woesearchaeota archaeon]
MTLAEQFIGSILFIVIGFILIPFAGWIATQRWIRVVGIGSREFTVRITGFGLIIAGIVLLLISLFGIVL